MRGSLQVMMMMMPSCQYAYCSHGWPAICHVVLHRSCVTMLPNERYTWRTVHKHSHTLYAVRLARWERMGGHRAVTPTRTSGSSSSSSPSWMFIASFVEMKSCRRVALPGGKVTRDTVSALHSAESACLPVCLPFDSRLPRSRGQSSCFFRPPHTR